MKKLFTLLLMFALLFGLTEPVQAKSVVYSKAKHGKMLKNLKKFSTMHYVSKVVKEDKDGEALQTSVVSIDTENGLMRMKSYMSGDINVEPDGDHIYDYKGKKLHTLKSLMGQDAAMESAMQGLVPFQDTSLKDIFSNMFQQVGLNTGVKGKATGGKEVYKKKLKSLSGVPASMFKKATVTLELKKKGKQYLPFKIVYDVHLDIAGNSSHTKMIVTYNKFDNKRVTLPNE